MQTILVYFCFAGLAATLPALFAIWLWRMDSHPVLEAVSRLRRLPVVARLAIVAFVVQLIVYGSTKTNGNGHAEGGVTNGPSALPPPLTMLAGEMPTVFGFTSNQFVAGFVLSHVGFGDPRGFEMPPSASVVGDWRLRGAADDWRPGPPSSLVAGESVVFADGRVQDRVRNPSQVYAPLHAPLGVVPEASWGLVAGTNAQSQVWHMTTASNSVVVTWEDVLLGRDTNSPVSVQAEFFENGSFEYRYDLSRAAAALSDPAVASNVVVGAWRGGAGEALDLSACATNQFPLSSVAFVALSGEDALVADRDGDGVSTYDEIFVHHTDPGLRDSDGDGICDGDEIAQSLDPLAVSVSNEELLARLESFQTNLPYAAAYVAVTNELVGYRLWDSFAATWPAGATNLVYERTVRIDSHGGWQHYYLSSKPDAAGGWSLGGLVLEWEDSCGESGTATASPVADSLYLPLSTNDPSFVTFRLRATAPDLRSVNPVYLVGYAPAVSIEGGRKVTTADGDVLDVFTGGAESAIGVSVDRSRRPCKAPPSQRERAMDGLADLEARTGGELRYEGDAYGGVIVASGAGVYRLPDVAVSGVDQGPPMRGPGRGGGGRYLLVLTPWVKYGDHCCAGGGLGWDEDSGYFVEREYPLDSGCLVREWHHGAGGEWTCECTPEAGCGLGDGNGFATVDVAVEGETVTATVRVGGEDVWSDSAVHVRGADGYGDGSEIEGGECDDCESDCSRGDCSGLEGSSLGSFRFRIPAGMPRKGQVAGFAYVVSEGPLAVTPAAFRYLLRGDVGATVTTNGSSRTVSCTCERGRTLQIEPMQDGTRVVVRKQATGELEHTWEVVNVGGSQNEIRVRQISRLDNVMQDWTYECVEDAESGGWSWRATDNIAGVREELERSETLNEDGLVSEVRTKYDAEGNWLGEVETVSQVVGERERAVLREVYRREETCFNTVVRTADYWRDAEHPARNGKLRLLLADDMPWEYHEWSKDGFETLLVEQRNGSPAPAEFPVAASNGFENASGLADAFLTTFSYEPFDGDDAYPDDYGKARCESRYVVRDGVATLVGRTWRRYTRVTACGYPAVKEETWRAASAGAGRGDAGNAYSWRTVFDPLAVGVPLVLRGETAEEMDEDGIRTAAEASVSGGRIALARRRWRGALQFPTYDVVEFDGTYGLALRTAKCLSDGGAVVDETVSLYDDQSRLRSAAHLDGTSETNAYSCCRLLWKRDREGRKVLRSAQTGTDHLYYAYEDVWITNVTAATNHEPPTTNHGFRVTQHFFDGLGRETNTVVYVGATPGEATDLAASDGKRLSEERTFYYGAGDDAVDFEDARGKVEVRRTYHGDGRDEFVTETYAGCDALEPAMRVVRTDVRNGGDATRREWDGKWTERLTWSDYDAAGCRVDYEVTVSSDYGTVTNSVARHDFLGRQVAVERPDGTVGTVYDGATTRALATTSASSDIVRTTANVYNELGELVGSTLDGVTRRNDTTYEDISNEWWKVTRSAVFAGGETNSASEVRERLTGLSDALRRQTVRISADGVVTETTESYDPATDLVTETEVSSVAGTTVRVSRHGVRLSSEAPDGTTAYDYDPLGRRVRETCGARVSETAYNAAGDMAMRRTRTGAESFAEESYAYDSFGNCIAETNALGCATTTAYDAMGNVVEVSGAATYPVRYAHDTEGHRTLLSTTRDGTIWDVTTWEYDPATGRRTAKRYADGSQSATSYTPDGLESVVTRPSLQWKENVYDERRQLVGVVSNDGSENAAFEYDDFGRMTAASNAVSTLAYSRCRNGIATNELVVVGTNSFVVERSVDAYGRLGGRGVLGGSFQEISYTTDNRVENVSAAGVTAAYAYADDGAEAGYSVSLSGGVTVTRQVVRDEYRPDLVLSVSNLVNGVSVSGFGYQHDAAGRVVSRNGDEFSYNERGEVVFSRRGAAENAEEDSYAYDCIGNLLLSACNSSTNTYTANNLNQYTSILRAPASPREISHDLDGNMVQCGDWTYTYDAANRLKTVSTNGVLLVTNFFDAMSRRVKKVTPEATHTYVYDGWNLVLERIERDCGETDTVEYFWGKDISGSLDGAGGIGGLLYLTVSNPNSQPQLYVPLYDANGNAMQYVDATGAVVASYVYDAFGRTLVSSGPQAELFRFRFSTKYHDTESGLVYYGYRFYSPNIARWLTRDPLEEQGGLNLYGFCGNAAVDRFDPYGLSEGQLKEFLNEFAVKLFWLNVAEKYFRGYKKWPISAEMLLMSIYGNFGPGRHAFPENGPLAAAIKSSQEYKKVISDLVENQTVAYKWHDLSGKSMRFNKGDLKTAVGKAEYTLKGDVCKRKNGSARLDLRVMVLDDYNFHEWGEKELKENGKILFVGNNLAYLSQGKGYLKVYPWSVSFDEKRQWPW